MSLTKTSIRFPLWLLLSCTAVAVQAEGRRHEIVIPQGQNAFVPQTLKISVGDTVRWINHDTTMKSHDFASVPGPRPEHKEIKIVELLAGQTAEHRFRTPGTYDYFCYVHQGMTGTVIVE